MNIDKIHKKGFTLIELLVSAFILALVMSGLTYVFFAGKRHLGHARSRIQAAELGRLFLAPLQMDVRQDQWTSNCLGSSTGCPTSTANDVTVDGINYQPTTVVTQNFSGTTLSKVRLTINWTEP